MVTNRPTSYGQTLGMPQPVNGGGFQPYAAGDKHYGGGRNFPTSGMVDRLGYAERDGMAKARRNAILRRLQSRQGGNNFSADAMRPIGGL